MSRLENFVKREKDFYWYKKYKLLSLEERRACVHFISFTEKLNKNEFAETVGRWFMDTANKPKNWTLMMEIVGATNTEAK